MMPKPTRVPGWRWPARRSRAAREAKGGSYFLDGGDETVNLVGEDCDLLLDTAGEQPGNGETAGEAHAQTHQQCFHIFLLNYGGKWEPVLTLTFHFSLFTSHLSVRRVTDGAADCDANCDLLGPLQKASLPCADRGVPLFLHVGVILLARRPAFLTSQIVGRLVDKKFHGRIRQ